MTRIWPTSAAATTRNFLWGGEVNRTGNSEVTSRTCGRQRDSYDMKFLKKQTLLSENYRILIYIVSSFAEPRPTLANVATPVKLLHPLC